MILTPENYFSPEAERLYMGSTQFKRFRECPSKALAILRGEWEEPKSKAILVGSYVDSHFSKGLDLFKAQTPELFTKGGELKAEYKHADYIIERIERDAVFMDEISGKTQVIMTGVIGGVPFKVKIDSLLPDRTVDLKIMADVDDEWQDGECKHFWATWGYDIQAAIYREVRAQNDGEVKPFRLAVATKEKQPDLRRYEFSDETLEEAYNIVCHYAPIYDKMKRGEIEAPRCGCCDYCRATRVLKEEDIEII